MERRRAALSILLIFVLLFLTLPLPVFAASDDDLLPGEPIDSPVYKQFDKDAYIFDYVPNENPDGWGEEIKIAVIQLLNTILNLWWKLYMYIVEFVIRVVNWAYDIQLFERLFQFIGLWMPNLIESVWDPLWFPVAAIGIGAAALYFMKGRSDRSLMSIGSIILILAFSPVLLFAVPKGLNTANTLFTTISGEIMSKLVQTKQLEQQQQPLATKLPGLGKPAQQEPAPFKPRSATGIYAPFFTPSVQQQVRIIKGIHAIDDSIWSTLVVQPYWIGNFGSTELGQAYWKDLLKNGTDESARNQWLREKGQIKDTGEAADKNFVIFTTAGFGERFYKVIVATLLPFVPLVVVLGGAIVILACKARAIGRAFLLIFDYLMSLYPGYGIANAIRSTIQVFASFIIALFYSVALAIFLAFWMKLSDSQTFTGLNFGDRILLVFVMLVGMWSGVNSIQRRLNQMPGLDGGAISANGGGRNELTMASGLIKRLANRTVGRPVGKVVNLAERAASKTAKGSLKLGAKSGAKVAGFVAGKAASYVGNLESVQAAKRRFMFKPGQATLTSNLSDEASNVYKEMVKRRMDPESDEDLQRYKKMHPNQDVYVDELKKWIQQKPYYQVHENPDLDGSIIPPGPPPKNSPEYIAWKNSPVLQDHWRLYKQARKAVHDKAYQKYAEKKKKYDKNPLRFFLHRPKFVEPSQRAYLREYRKLLREREQKQQQAK